MVEDVERRLLQPASDQDRAGMTCLLRMRSEGRSLVEIAAGLEAETGMVLPPEAIDRVLREIAGPVPRADGGDPAYFSGYLGGG